MIIKPAANQDSQLAILQNLLSHPQADAATHQRIEQEIKNIRAGQRGEQEAAHEMELYYGHSKNWMIIHDLRIEHGGQAAQIDHLIMNRALEMWVCESKHFAQGVAINEQGEFTSFYDGKPRGMASPIEQNNKHIMVLTRLLSSGAVKLPTRLGFTLKPTLKSLVLVSKKARISRPKANIQGLDVVIKADMLQKTIEQSFKEANPLGIAKVVSPETLQALACEIAVQHKPIAIDWHAKFGLSPSVAAASPVQPVPRPSESPRPQQKMVCHACAVSVPDSVVKFCGLHKPRFGGHIYCIACQKKMPAP